jgi:hypothetical protein
MKTTLSGSDTKLRAVPVKEADSIRNNKFDSNEIDESDMQSENTMNKEFQYSSESQSRRHNQNVESISILMNQQ